MKLGVVFPQTEIGADPAIIKDYAQTTEGLGYDYLLVFDHVIGANPDRPGGWKGPYTIIWKKGAVTRPHSASIPGSPSVTIPNQMG